MFAKERMGFMPALCVAFLEELSDKEKLAFDQLGRQEERAEMVLKHPFLADKFARLDDYGDDGDGGDGGGGDGDGGDGDGNVCSHLVAAVDNDRVGGEIVGRSRQKVVEDAGAEGRAVRVDGRPVEAHHLDERRYLVGVGDPAVDVTQRVRQLGNPPGPGVEPGEGGQAGEDVQSQLQDVQAGGQHGELPLVQRLGQEIVRQVEALEMCEAGDVLSQLSYPVVGEVEMFNIGQQSHVRVLTEEMSHHGVGHLDPLQIGEPGEVLRLQTLDQTVRDLDRQHITGSPELDIQQVSEQYWRRRRWRLSYDGGWSYLVEWRLVQWRTTPPSRSSQ